MAKKNNNYFELIKTQASHCVEASDLLEGILAGFEAARIDEYRTKIHAIEHNADGVRHDIMSKLSTEFITPIDQEDILRLIQIIDDITDALDEVVLDIYMYCVDKIPSHAVDLSHKVNECVHALLDAASELKNFKKPDLLREKLIKINDIESDADDLYTAAIHELFAKKTDVGAVIGTKAIYDALEECCDLCEHASDVIEQVIIKNT